MKSSQPPIDEPDRGQEEVVAYLDGELSSQESRGVEERLASDPQFRDQLRQMERAWGLLDELPRPETDEQFTASTVEMVAIRAADEGRPRRQPWPQRLFGGWLFRVGGVLLALVLGFGLVAGVTTLLARVGVFEDPDARLLKDLPVLVNLDLYQQVDSMQVLHELDKSGQFSFTAPIELEPLEARSPLFPLTPLPRTSDERTGWVRDLAPADKKQLAERLDRFDAMQRDEQQRMREFDRQLAADPKSESLRGVLARYCQWLITLTPDQRMDLRALPPAARMQRVAELRKRDQPKLLNLQAMDDLRAVMDWTQQIADRNEQQMLASVTTRVREELRASKPAARRQRLAFLALTHWQRGGFGFNPAVSAEEFNELKRHLSTACLEQMVRFPDSAEQWSALTSGLVAEIKPKLPQDKRLLLEIDDDVPKEQFCLMVKLLSETHSKGRAVSDNDLWRFFREKLTKQERESFKHLPPDEFVQQLRARYMKSKKAERNEAKSTTGDDTTAPPASKQGHSHGAAARKHKHGQDNAPAAPAADAPNHQPQGGSEADRSPPPPLGSGNREPAGPVPAVPAPSRP